jgi:type II secretory pathway component PulF
MCMVVFTWPLTILLVILASKFVPPEETLTVILYIVWITNVGKASNYFIFFAFRLFYFSIIILIRYFSKEYRKAFLRQLVWVPYFGKFVHAQASQQLFKKTTTIQLSTVT